MPIHSLPTFPHCKLQTRMVKEGAVTQDEMREAFTLFDSDKDGRLAPEDLGTVMRSLGENPTQADLKSIMSSEGIRGPFDFPKFAEVMKRHAKGGGFQNQLRDAFKVLDKDDSGSINVRELRHILTSVGEKLDPSEFDDWIKEIHVDDKGFISYDAFISRMVAK